MDYEKEYKKLKADISKAYLYAQTDSTKAVLESILSELKESKNERLEKQDKKPSWRLKSYAKKLNLLPKEIKARIASKISTN